MLKCWRVRPESRPRFYHLVKSLGDLLESGVAEHYINLNEPYVRMNPNNFAKGQTDYLALMASPDSPAPPVPQIDTSTQEVAPDKSLPKCMSMSSTINN